MPLKIAPRFPSYEKCQPSLLQVELRTLRGIPAVFEENILREGLKRPSTGS